jgi:hypothetical protein
LDCFWSDRHAGLEQVGRQINEFSRDYKMSNIGIYISLLGGEKSEPEKLERGQLREVHQSTTFWTPLFARGMQIGGTMQSKII